MGTHYELIRLGQASGDHNRRLYCYLCHPPLSWRSFCATAAALESQRIYNNRYVGGVDTYLQVITAQNSALLNERNDVDILRRRMDATVSLVKALGGGWDRTQLPPQ